MTIEELYLSIVDDVFRNVREAFTDEGVDEQTWLALKNSWASKLKASSTGNNININAINPATSSATQNSQQQQQQQQQLQPQPQQPSNQQSSIIPSKPIIQLDGSNGTSDEDDNDEELDEEYLDEDDLDSDEDNQETNNNRGDEDPLNSGDDISNDEGVEVFETENVVVCQYDKITRNRNKWKFHLKDGIMSLNGKDYVFQKAVGDAEW